MSRGVKELQSCSQSPSHQFPRSKSRSPVRYRKECNKQKEHSPKDTTSYRHHRRARDHDFGEYHRHRYGSSYGRARYFSGGRSDANYDRNKGRSTTRRSRSRSPTWRRPVDSHSHSPGSFRSESRDSRCRIPSRISGSHRMSRSPINDYSISNRTQQGKDINTSKPKVLRRSPSLENCLSHRSAGLQVDLNVNASKQLEREGRPRRELLFTSKSSSRSTCSPDYSGERTTEAINIRKNFQSAPGDGKNPVYVTSDCIKNFMDSPASSFPKSTSSMDYPTYTYCLPRKEDAGNGHDTIVNSEHGLLNVTVKEDDLDDSTLHTQQEVFNHEVDAMHLSAPAKFASIYPSPADPRPSRFQSSERVSKYQPRSTKKTAKHAKQYHHRQGAQKY
jgi:hypothetical protein